MIRLNGIYKEVCREIHEFKEWMEHSNPEVEFSVHDEYKVKVAYKVGKKRKLKSAIVSCEDIGSPNCPCCGSIFVLKVKHK